MPTNNPTTARIRGWLVAAIAVAVGLQLPAHAEDSTQQIDRTRARTSFQSADPFNPSWNIRTDVAMAYGVDDTLTSRIAEWKLQGYIPEVMTGSAWGQYEAYIDGRFDGHHHEDEGQADGAGNTIWHHPGVPYMVPSPSYVDYLTSLAQQAVDAGGEALYLEEPEFWSRAGYSESFKRLWRAEYGEDWRRPDSSPDAFWRSSKLKYVLYRRTLETVFTGAKQYAASRGRALRCYVPTHSLVNYSQWAIVSPESSLMDMGACDGYIAQVWTGTARQPNRYAGVKRERTFETAYLEFASMHAMTAPTGRTVYFLADPVEDDPQHTWDDYRQNYERVLAASLLFPDVSHFEAMPWPSRVFLGKYPAGSYGAANERITIPPSYAAELMICVNALNDMEQPEYEWSSGSSDIGVLVSDTMMFQRGSPWASDNCFDEFYGLALPLVKAGIPVRSVQLEQILNPRALAGTSALLMSYDHMKPLKPEYNRRLADWVRHGGVLLYFGTDSDAFVSAREWWNSGAGSAGSPRQDLLKQLGVADELVATSTPQKARLQKVGKGVVGFYSESPTRIARETTGPQDLIRNLSGALSTADKTLQTTNSIVLRRGPYVIGAVLDESVSTQPLRLNGTYADLFTSEGRIVQNPVISPATVFLYKALPDDPPAKAQVLVSSARVEKTERSESQTTFTVAGPEGTPGILRFVQKHVPRSVLVNGNDCKFEWNQNVSSGVVHFKITEIPTCICIGH